MDWRPIGDRFRPLAKVEWTRQRWNDAYLDDDDGGGVAAGNERTNERNAFSVMKVEACSPCEGE